jgi:predicted Zn-dependent peptidase
VEETNFEKAHELFKMLYGNPKDFTFIISGAYDEQEILPLVQKYLGNLPNSSVLLECNLKNDTIFRSHHSRSLMRLPSPEYYRMKNVLYGVKFIEKAENPYDWKEHLKVEALAEIASHKVWGLRFNKGYSLYMVGVSGVFDNDMNRYEISSTIPCIPEELPSIREEVKEIFSEIKSGVISKEEFEQGIQRMKMLYDAERAGLSRVMKPKLYEHYRYNQPWLDPLEVEAFVKSLTIQDIILTANIYLTEENMVEFVMKDREAQNKL